MSSDSISCKKFELKSLKSEDTSENREISDPTKSFDIEKMDEPRPEIKLPTIPSLHATKKHVQYRDQESARFYREQYKETYAILGISCESMVGLVQEQTEDPASPPPLSIRMRKQESFQHVV